MSRGCRRCFNSCIALCVATFLGGLIATADPPKPASAPTGRVVAVEAGPGSNAKPELVTIAEVVATPIPPEAIAEFMLRDEAPNPHGPCGIVVYEHTNPAPASFAAVAALGHSLWDDIEISSLTNRNLCQITTQVFPGAAVVPYTITLDVYNDFPTLVGGACDLSTVTHLATGTATITAAGIQIVVVPMTMINPIPDTRPDDPVPPGCGAEATAGSQIDNADYFLRFTFSQAGPGPIICPMGSVPLVGCNDFAHGRCRTATDSGLFAGFTGGLGGRFVNTTLANGSTATTGRCCNTAGDCTETEPSACVAPSVFSGLGSTCTGTPCRGRCCAADGTCTLTTAAGCVAPNTFAGLGTNCDGTPCEGKCCQPDGFCAVLSPNACTGAGFVFSGIGTTCNPATPEECLGRCCLPDGSCIADGRDPCLTNGGTFGGVGVACGNGALCRGRCCVNATTCIPDSGPNACAVAGGTLTLGLDCVGTTDFNYAVSIPIPDGPAGGGAGTPVSNVQNVSGLTGNITDLDVDVRITHTWVGDLVVDITHLGTTVTVIDLMGQATPAGGGCNSNNLDVVLDDEGVGGPIESLCGANTNATVPTSPPKYTPNNPLSAFDGMNPNGDWTITCRDTFQADVGTLIGWSLHFANGTTGCAPSCACKGDMNGSGTVNGADINRFAQCVASGGGAGCACADINGGGINASDVTPFVNALIAGTACIP